MNSCPPFRELTYDTPNPSASLRKEGVEYTNVVIRTEEIKGFQGWGWVIVACFVSTLTAVLALSSGGFFVFRHVVPSVLSVSFGLLSIYAFMKIVRNYLDYRKEKDLIDSLLASVEERPSLPCKSILRNSSAQSDGLHPCPSTPAIKKRVKFFGINSPEAPLGEESSPSPE